MWERGRWLGMDYFVKGASAQSAEATELAPLCVPVELRRADIKATGAAGQRWFRIGLGLGPDRLRLRSALPEELCGPPLRVRLQLPPPTAQAEGLGEDWQGGLDLRAVAGEVVVDRGTEREHAEPRLLLFRNLTPPQRALIEEYITLRQLADE